MLRVLAAGCAGKAEPFDGDRASATTSTETRSLLLADVGSDDPLIDADARLALVGIAVVMSASVVAVIVVAPIHRSWLLLRKALRHCRRPSSVGAR